MGDIRRPPTLRAIDEIERVPELRRSKQPLPTWVRSLAFLIGAGAGGGAGVAGVATTIGPAVMRIAGVALKKDIDPQLEALSIGQRASDKVAAERSAAVAAILATIQKDQIAQSVRLAAISRAIAKRAPKAPKDEAQ